MADIRKALRWRTRRTAALAPLLSTAAASGSAAEKPLAPATVTLWVGFTQRELKIIKGVVARFEQANPGVKVKTIGGISDDKIVAAIRGGNAPDIAQSFSTDN